MDTVGSGGKTARNRGIAGGKISLRLLPGLLLLAGLLSGCGESGTSPTPGGLTLEGRVALTGGGSPEGVTVRLFAAPVDEALVQVVSEYPAVGFSPLVPMLFNPLAQAPLATAVPAAGGAFRFEDLGEGTYVLDAVQEGYGCPAPRAVVLPGDENPDTLWLAPVLDVGGNLASATWPQRGVYRVTSDLLVLPGATLTIHQDVLVLVNGDYDFIVKGGLQVQGAASHPVRFQPSAEFFASGDTWAGLRLDQPSFACALEGALIRGAATALRVIDGQADVRECLFDAPAAFGVYFSAGAEGALRQCVCRDGDQGFVADNCDPALERNAVLRMSGPGLTVKTNSQSLVYGNAVLDCSIGLWSDWNTAPLVQRNLFSGGDIGLDAQNGFTAEVSYNEFRGQTEKAIYLHVRNCYPQIEHNNFLDMPTTILHVNGSNSQQADTVYALYNYWDGEDGLGLPGRIIDGHDIGSPDNIVGPVEYMPFLQNPEEVAGP
ncbi:MAG: right-handed parallel beta-helix repeat-containing protein [Candidatus Zixiibacteriota bacterium]|nr:MAG: right-handed parallel beta-helix repeat-containing protein [candidate division Zixibacteria bacterium]